MDLVLFGIQGSGKGTQAKRLAAEHGYTIFEAGGVLRSIAVTDSALGKTVASFIDNGKLVPNDIMMAAVRQSIEETGKDQKILFDGMPRFLEQMKSFNAMMAELGRDFQCIHIVLEESMAIERILGRGKLEGRIDDQDEERIRTRLGWYHEKTEPVIQEYSRRGKVMEVNGEGTMDEVYERIEEVLSVAE